MLIRLLVWLTIYCNHWLPKLFPVLLVLISFFSSSFFWKILLFFFHLIFLVHSTLVRSLLLFILNRGSKILILRHHQWPLRIRGLHQGVAVLLPSASSLRQLTRTCNSHVWSLDGSLIASSHKVNRLIVRLIVVVIVLLVGRQRQR